MGVPNQFNDIIQQHLNVFAAWVPIVNKFSLGDYGIMADGVFSKLGNVKEDFGVTFTTGEGDEASIDFTSANAKVIKLDGNTEVSVIPAGAVNAKIQIEFTGEKSFMVKSPKITVTTIENIQALAKQLKTKSEWDGKWRVVHQVYVAEEALVVCTKTAGTKLTFSGDGTALGKMKLGSAGVNIDTDRELGLKINGKQGVIGLGLFRIKSKIFGGWKTDVLAVGKEDADLVEELDATAGNNDDL
jgi:hypothetical protein